MDSVEQKRDFACDKVCNLATHGHFISINLADTEHYVGVVSYKGLKQCMNILRVVLTITIHGNKYIRILHASSFYACFSSCALSSINRMMNRGNRQLLND